MKLKRLFISVTLALTMVLGLALPVLADTYLSYYPTTIVDSSGGAREALPVITGINGQSLIDAGLIKATGLDTRMSIGDASVAGNNIPYMVSETQITTYLDSLPAYGQTEARLYTGYSSDVSGFDIITGTDGYITIPDDDTLELGSDFEIEQKGYVDTTGGADTNLVYKEDAFRSYIDGASDITSAIIGYSTVYPSVAAVNGGTSASDTSHTVNLPANIASGNLLLVSFATYGNPTITFPNEGTDWIQLYEVLGDGSYVTSGIWYRIADGGEGATITVTTSNAQVGAHTSYRIINYSGVPEVGTATKGTSTTPDPPSLTPSWGSESTLWFAACGYAYSSGPYTVSSYPGSYTDGRNDYVNAATHCGVGTARRELTAVSEDPGTFTLSDANCRWVANTVAIAPVFGIERAAVTATGIDSEEYTVKTYGVDNEPEWATGDVLHFTGAADSNVNAGAIHNTIAKLWISFWFKLDGAFDSTDVTSQGLVGKFNSGTDLFIFQLQQANGQLECRANIGGAGNIYWRSTQTSWNADQWYHVIISVSDVEGKRLIVDGGAPVTNANALGTPAGGDFVIGDLDDPGAGNGFIGEIQNVILGIGDLSAVEEAALYNGIAPTGGNAPTEYWYIDEGTGTAITSYGSVATEGTADAACTWETSTYTTGKTGRLCDFYIEVDDGVTDADRWGGNLKGVSVPDNANDWKLNQNNVMPKMEYYKHTVGGTLIAWYEPNTIVDATNYDGTADAGSSDVKIIDAELIQADDYWNDALLTITSAGGAAPEGETAIITDFIDASNELQFAALTAAVEADDTYTVDFATLTDRQGGDEDAKLTWGVNSATTLTYGKVISYTTTSSTASEEGGYTVPEADMPTEWYGTASNLANLPLYDMYLGIGTQTGIPVQTLYVLSIVTVCFAFAIAGFVMFNSVMMSVIGVGVGLGIGSSMTVVPLWIFFSFLIFAIGIMYLKGRSGV